MESKNKISILNKAKKEKNDEFYTLYHDIQKEISAYLKYDINTFRDKTVLLPCDDPEWSNFTKYFVQNFTSLGIKRLISTSYSYNGRGKIFIIDANINNDMVIDINALKWDYLAGDGDFRSDEIKKLRNEADIIVTNPPFSLFREFIDWIFETDKKCLVIGNMNAITYKNVFPLIKDNKLWLGALSSSVDREFRVPDDYEIRTQNFRVDENGRRYIRLNWARWFTNIDYGRRHRLLQLNTISENKQSNKRIKDDYYQPYSNYEAIEVSSTDAIPSDYNGLIGVPISFLDKYCPDQFEIVDSLTTPELGGRKKFKRIIIRNKNNS